MIILKRVNILKKSIYVTTFKLTQPIECYISKNASETVNLIANKACILFDVTQEHFLYTDLNTIVRMGGFVTAVRATNNITATDIDSLLTHYSKYVHQCETPDALFSLDFLKEL